MADGGPLNPNHRVTISYPDVPSNCVNSLNDLISTISGARDHLNTSSGRVQGFMNQANGAVQHVVNISQGKGAQALAETWYYSLSDGKQSHTGMSDTATHLDTTLKTLNDNLQAIINGMSAIETVKNNGGTVSEADSYNIQYDINNLTDALGNIGTALDLAATAINTMNSGWPLTCATGFTPGSTVYPTFKPDSFGNNIVHMSGTGGSAADRAAAESITKKLGEEEGGILIIIAEEKGASLSELEALVNKGVDSDTIVRWLENGKSIDGAGTLLNRGISTDQVGKWIEEGANLKGVNKLLDKNVPIDSITKDLTKANDTRWDGIGKRTKNNIADALNHWERGTTDAINDGTTFGNNQGRLPNRPYGSYKEYTVSSRGVKIPKGSGADDLRIVVDETTGNVYYTQDHYKTFIPIPWSFLTEALGR